MKYRKFIFTAIILNSILISTSSYAETYDWPVLDIDLSSCMPSGPVGKGKEWLDPKKFWVHQYVLLESAIDEDRLNYIENVPACKDQYKNDAGALQRCIGYYTNRTNAMKNCLFFTKKMCRSHGGYC